MESYGPMANNTAQAIANIQMVQDALQTLSLLMLTNYMFPKQAVLKGWLFIILEAKTVIVRKEHVVLGFRSLKSRSQIPDYATYNIIEERLQYLLQYCGFPFDFQNEICDRSYQQVLGRQLAYSLIVNLYPKSRGKVTLNTTNPDDAPLVETGYFTEEEDMNNMVEYVKDYLPLVNTTYFKKVDGRMVDPVGDKCSMHEYGSDDYWKCYVYCMASSLWNFGGTCAMGSVVDSKLKVYGVQRLRVVDASVMPTVVAGGNYLATVMIAEKASDMINHDHRA